VNRLWLQGISFEFFSLRPPTTLDSIDARPTVFISFCMKIKGEFSKGVLLNKFLLQHLAMVGMTLELIGFNVFVYEGQNKKTAPSEIVKEDGDVWWKVVECNFVCWLQEEVEGAHGSLNVSLSARKASSTSEEYFSPDYIKERVFLNRIILSKLATVDVSSFTCLLYTTNYTSLNPLL